MAEGELLNDNMVIDLVAKEIKKIPEDQEFIIDGFPRTLVQAKWIVKESDSHPIKVIHIKIDELEVVRRLKLRNRQDDNIEAIHKRINEYNQLIEPVLEEFKAKDVSVYDIDGSRGMQEVSYQILADLQEIKEPIT
jgi:adenylate kinase